MANHSKYVVKSQRKARVKYRALAIERLGGKCCKCSFSDPRALQFDHIAGGGGRERIRGHGGGITYLKDIALGRRSDIQLLCANCNVIKRFENKEIEVSDDYHAVFSPKVL